MAESTICCALAMPAAVEPETLEVPRAPVPRLAFTPAAEWDLSGKNRGGRSAHLPSSPADTPLRTFQRGANAARMAGLKAKFVLWQRLRSPTCLPIALLRLNPVVDVGASIAPVTAELRRAGPLAVQPPPVGGLARHSDVGPELGPTPPATEAAHRRPRPADPSAAMAPQPPCLGHVDPSRPALTPGRSGQLHRWRDGPRQGGRPV